MSMKRSLTVTDSAEPASKKYKAYSKKRSFKRKPVSSKSAIFELPELKQNETYLASSGIATQNAQLLNGIAEGSTALTREGRVIKFRNLRIKLFFSSATGAGGSFGTVPTNVHWAVVLDRQCNGSTISYSTVFDTSVVTDAALAYKNTAAQDARFKVIREGMVSCPITSGGALPIVDEYMDLGKTLGPEDRGCKFSGTGATESSIATNALWLVMAVSGQGAFADGTVPVRYSSSSKLRFTDV